MKDFYTWLKDENLDEGWGKNLALAGALGASALGGYKYAQQTPNNPQQQPVQQPVQQADGSTWSNLNNTRPMSRADQWKARMSRKSAQQQKGTPNELQPQSETEPGASEFVP